ncbi:unnamed protein product [Sphenostylis stenocarpa]|uniref:Exonuclease domain-containing protein n=1 Tax=Sphenostylis stenocarpa TaxID=92480 RepID=A0AA86VJZ8_9FABA|nr:unnamed protein product [Sphenostylis stenocarpa]
MEKLANSFSVLELDADDNHVPTTAVHCFNVGIWDFSHHEKKREFLGAESWLFGEDEELGTKKPFKTKMIHFVNLSNMTQTTHVIHVANLSRWDKVVVVNVYFGGQIGNSDRGVNHEISIIPVKNKKQDQEIPVTPSCEYKLPLVWIDLEMTGLNIEADRILEIACIITDGYLTKTVEGPDLVIHQTKECLDRMGEWCQNHHAASGLTKRVLQSTISEGEAEKQLVEDKASRHVAFYSCIKPMISVPVMWGYCMEALACCVGSVIEFIKRYINVDSYTPLLAGNSIYVDFQFLKKYMPKLASLFSHVLVDVSSVKALCIRWYPKDQKKAPSKVNRHRAMDDIRESIEELRYYKANIFKPKSRK